jgi:hypothetical protein
MRYSHLPHNNTTTQHNTRWSTRSNTVVAEMFTLTIPLQTHNTTPGGAHVPSTSVAVQASARRHSCQVLQRDEAIHPAPRNAARTLRRRHLGRPRQPQRSRPEDCVRGQQISSHAPYSYPHAFPTYSLIPLAFILIPEFLLLLWWLLLLCFYCAHKFWCSFL